MRNLNLGRVAAGLLRPYWPLALAAVALGGLALIDDALKSGSSPSKALGFVLLCPFMI